jgi:hypothetical protein
VSPALDHYRNTATHAASCLSAVRARWDQLRYELGTDLEISRPLLTRDEIDELPPVVRHLTRGITSLPFLRQVTREAEFFTGLDQYAERPCSFLQATLSAASDLPRSWSLQVPAS